MLKDYKDEIDVLIAWYRRAKEVTIQAEAMDCLNKGYIQPMNEQRYCLDHFVRAINYESKDDCSSESIKKALLSAIGHLQRSYSDSVEWILISVREEYCMVLEKFSNEQISQGFPEYYSKIRTELDKVTEIVNHYKINKSVEQASDPNALSDNQLKMLDDITGQFLSEEIVEKLITYLSTLHQKEGALLEIKERDKKNSLKEKIIIPIVAAVIGTVLGSVVVALLLG